SLSAAHVKSWVLTIDSTTITSSTTGAQVNIIGPQLEATPTQITLAAPTPPDTLAEFQLLANPDGTPSSLTEVDYFRAFPDAGKYDALKNNTFSWIKLQPSMGGTDPWVIASTAATVPEPSTAVVAVLGAVTFLACGWSRHHRAQRRQAAA